MRLARRLGFSTEEIRNVGIGGLFHDVGKLALSDRIFTNRETHLPIRSSSGGALPPADRCCPAQGYRLSETGCGFRAVSPRTGGRKRLPLRPEGRGNTARRQNCSIADCFDAVTTDRPYQKGSRLHRPLKSFVKAVASCSVKSTWRHLSKISKKTESFRTPTPIRDWPMNSFGWPPDVRRVAQDQNHHHV
jgi:hypothetical protein